MDCTMNDAPAMDLGSLRASLPLPSRPHSETPPNPQDGGLIDRDIVNNLGLPDSHRRALAELIVAYFGNSPEVVSMIRRGWVPGRSSSFDSSAPSELPDDELASIYTFWLQGRGGRGENLSHFHWLLDSPILRSYQPRVLWESLALIILFSAVARTTPFFDSLTSPHPATGHAVRLARTLATSEKWPRLPLHVKAVLVRVLRVDRESVWRCRELLQREEGVRGRAASTEHIHKSLLGMCSIECYQ
jgi:hypothetical protein